MFYRRGILSLFKIIALFLACNSMLVTVIAASIQVELVPADQKLQSRLQKELPESAPKPTTAFELRRQVIRASEQLSNYLNSEGYFAASIRQEIRTADGLTGHIIIEPGPRFTIRQLKVETGLARLSAQPIFSEIGIKQGDIAFPRNILKAEQKLKMSMRGQGYAFAALKKRSLAGDKEAGTVDVRLNIEPHDKVFFGETLIGSSGRTRAAYLNKLIPYTRGDLYTPLDLEILNSRLSDTRVFTSARADLDGTGQMSPDQNGKIHNVILTLKERERYTLSAGASFSSSEGGGLTTGWTNRNFTRRTDILTTSLIFADQQQSFLADWNIPNLFGYGKSLSLSGNAGLESTDGFEKTFFTAGGVVDIASTPQKTYALGVSSEFTRETDALGERDLQILSGSGAIRFDDTNDILDPDNGYRLEARLEPGVIIGDTASQYILSTVQMSGYQTFKSVTAAARLRLGSVYGADTVELPTSRRFYAGGGGSARGFAYQSIGPMSSDGTPLGGRGLVETSAEMRWRYNKTFGLVGFIDGASVTSNDMPRFKDLSFGAGLGVRYYTGVGPIRFDVATPIDRRETDDPVQLYISLGQAF